MNTPINTEKPAEGLEQGAKWESWCVADARKSLKGVTIHAWWFEESVPLTWVYRSGSDE